MFEASVPVLSAWANAAVFVLAGLVNFTAMKSVRDVYERWDISPAFYRTLGVIEIIAAICLALPTLRLWGVVLAVPIAFGSVVMLLDHRHYVYAASMVLMLSGLGAATLAIPQSQSFVITKSSDQALVQYADGSSVR
jgi:hypothetical protein